MSQTILVAGDASNGSQIQSGNDGTVVIQSGLAGAKVNALSIAAGGNISLPVTAAPCFSAYQSTLQSVASSISAKILLQTKEFDTANAFDAVTNYRFQPLVAGYYQVTGAVYFATTASTLLCSIYKNGAEFKRGVQSGTAAGTGQESQVSSLVFLNGTTDYIELWGYQNSGAANNTSATSINTYFQAAMIRPA